MKLIPILNTIQLKILSSNLSFDTSISDSTPTHLKNSETSSTKRIPDFIIVITPTRKTIENAKTNSSEKYVDIIYEKIKIEKLKKNILQNLLNRIKEIFDSKFTTFKSKCEKLAETSSVRDNKQTDHLQNGLKTKIKIIDQHLKSLNNLTKSELESKNNNIHELIDQTNDEEKKLDTTQNNIKLNPTLLKTNLMKRTVPIVPRKLKNTLEKTKQIIRKINLNPRM